MNDESPETELASSQEEELRLQRKKRRILRNVLIGFLSILLILFSLVYGYWRWTFPYGHRCCVSSIIYVDLLGYAGNHDGWFPKDGATPLECFQKLCVDARGCGYLAGFSGSRKKTVARLSSGGKLDEKISSWIYFPGLREDDEEILTAQGIRPEHGLAIAWERQEGVGMGGFRASEGSHLVIFSKEAPTQISGGDWDDFVKEQEKCRRVIFASRAQQSATNAPPPKTN